MSVLSHPLSAPRGATMSCNGRPEEAALRLLMNHLDSHMAGRTDDGVAYGVSGRAARTTCARRPRRFQRLGTAPPRGPRRLGLRTHVAAAAAARPHRPERDAIRR